MEITESARKHEIDDADMIHGWENALRLIEFEYDGEDRILAIGPDAAGNLLELVAVPVGSRPESSTQTSSDRSSTTTSNEGDHYDQDEET